MQNGDQTLIDSLKALGATRCFGVPGESYLAVLDALHDTAGTLDYVVCRNERGRLSTGRLLPRRAPSSTSPSLPRP